jgi:dTDP-4-dehydrorhamnose reductase
MRILLTGSQGQVGQAIIHHANKNSTEYTLIATNRSTCDITSIDVVNQNILQHKPNIIINCAAYTQVDKAESPDEKQNVWNINVKGPENLAKLCVEKNILLFHLSTDYVFDGFKTSAYTEKDETNPISEYGKSKLAGEQAIIQNTDQYLILRVSWVFSEFGQNSLKNMIKLMQTREELSIVSDQIACPTYARDIAEVFLKLSLLDKTNIKSGIYHYCNSPEITRYELARKIYALGNNVKHLQLKDLSIKPISTSAYPTPAQRPQNSILECSLFSQTFGISIKPWELSLKNCLENIR